jgi:ATP-dependent exoDNAse (exonuclease V) beta subunit
MLLQYDMLPMVWKKQTSEQYEQEENLLYVALTRSKDELILFGKEQIKAIEPVTPEQANLLTDQPQEPLLLEAVNPDFEPRPDIVALAETPQIAPISHETVIDTPEPLIVQSSPVLVIPAPSVDPVLVRLQEALATFEAIDWSPLADLPPVESIPQQTIAYARLDLVDLRPHEISTLFDVVYLQSDGHVTPEFRRAHLDYHINLYRAHESELTEYQQKKLSLMEKALAEMEGVKVNA